MVKHPSLIKAQAFNEIFNEVLTHCSNDGIKRDVMKLSIFTDKEQSM